MMKEKENMLNFLKELGAETEFVEVTYDAIAVSTGIKKCEVKTVIESLMSEGKLLRRTRYTNYIHYSYKILTAQNSVTSNSTDIVSVSTKINDNKLMIIDERNLFGKHFRIYGTKENPLFLAKDVAEWIEHTHVTNMLRNIDEEERCVITVHTFGGNQEALALTEDGLYEVLMQSRKPIAKAFKKEVKKILKQIRQTGGYINISKATSELDIARELSEVYRRTVELQQYKLDGNAKVITLTEGVEMLNIKGLTTTLFNKVLINEGYGVYRKINEKSRFEPSDRFRREFVSLGDCLTREKSDGSCFVTYTKYMFNVILQNEYLMHKLRIAAVTRIV